MLIGITDWERALTQHTDLDRSTVNQYIGDAQRFVMWFRTDERGESVADITVQDAKDYHDALVAARRAPATLNRALISLALLLDASGRGADNPFQRMGAPMPEAMPVPPKSIQQLEQEARQRLQHGGQLGMFDEEPRE